MGEFSLTMTWYLLSFRGERRERGETDVLIDLSLSSPLQDFHTAQMTCSRVKLNQSQCRLIIGQLAGHCALIGWKVFITHSQLKSGS